MDVSVWLSEGWLYYWWKVNIDHITTAAGDRYAAFQSPRANGAHDFPSCANRSIHVPTGNFPFAPLEKWRRFFCFSLHCWEKDGVVAYQKTLYYRSSTSLCTARPRTRYSRITHAPALLVRGFVSRKKGARSMGEEKEEGKIIIIIINMKKKEENK